MTEIKQGADDPLVGDRLVRIDDQHHAVALQFNDSIVEISSPFMLKTSDGVALQVRTVDALQHLIGSSVSEVVWTDRVQFRFDNGHEIEVPAAPGRFRGTIRGRHDMTWEDF